MFIEMFKRLPMPLLDAEDDFGGAGIDGDTEDINIEEEDGNAQPEAEKFIINYLGEEKEIDLEEAKTLAQKGMNYEPLQQKWEQSKSTISKIEEIARKAGFVNADGHGDIDAYYAAANEQMRAAEIGKLTDDWQLPQELAEELYLSRQERAERKAEKEKQDADANKQKQFSDLLNFYKEVHGKDMDPATTKLPQEVWQAVEDGVPPKYAYAEYLSKQSVKERAIEQANEENGQASPGGVSGKGTTAERDYFTSEEIDKLTDEDYDNPDVFEKVRRSMKKLK